MLPKFVFLLAVMAVCSADYEPSSGPVYINPSAGAPPLFESETRSDSGSKITQTVYGFLDFTTTIGNTVMVFSPQSAAPAQEPAKPKEKVIETKAPSKPSSEIKPSKTLKSEESSSGSKKEQPQVIYSVVEVIGGEKVQPSKTAKSAQAPALSSKVEVKEGAPVKIKKGQKQSSSKAEARDEKNRILSSKAEKAPQPTIISSIVEIVSNEKPSKIVSSIVEVKSSSDEEPAVEVDGNNIDKPEYDFLNRQPSQVVDESYRVIDLKPKFHLKPKSRSHGQSTKEGKKDSHSTGVLTKYGGTVVKDGATTVHETQVIGTYISGKYAQVLQSTSRVVSKPKVSPTQTTRILKTATPHLSKSRVHLEPTPAGSLHEETALPLEALFHADKSPSHIRPSRRPGPAVGGPAGGKNDYKNKYRARQSSKEQDANEEYGQEEAEVHANREHKKSRGRSSKSSHRSNGNRYGKSQSESQISAVPTYREEASATPSGRKYQNSNRRSNGGFRSKTKNKDKDYDSGDKEDGYTRRGFKPKVQASTVDSSGSGTSLYKFKLQRPSGRWSYKTTPKPRVTIRRQDTDQNEVTTSGTPSQPQYNPEEEAIAERREYNEEYDEAAAEKMAKSEPTATASTIKVQISTPADFSDIYYEIATIKSPYTFQVGTLKNTRYITVTSTIEKTLQSIESTLPIIPSKISEPLTENILATTAPLYKENNLPVDSSVATLPPIALGTDVETPPLETITETFSTTQTLLKTHILPVIRGGNDTTSYTLVQTYEITRLVTATKTLPPMEVYQFVPSKTLNEFNTRLEEAGSELHLELDFGDENNHEEDDEDHPPAVRAFPPDLDLANVGNDFDVSSVDGSKLSEALRLAKQLKAHRKPTEPPTTTTSTTPAMTPEQVQQLALLRFLNPAASLPQVVTSSKPIIKLETVYESHLIPLFNGVTTSYSTISRPVATVSKTEYEVVTSTIANPLPQVPVNPLNPLFPAAAPQFSLTSTPVVTSTMITATESKVLKLTFGAKTAYTTLYSTRVVPTVLTTYLTTNVPVVPTAFPGFFPTFGGFPGYVG